MGIFNFWKKDARNNHTFDEKDRELSQERRRLNIELENARKRFELEELQAEHDLKMAQIDAEMDDLYPAPDMGQQQYSPEDMIAMKLIDRIGVPKTPPTPPPVGAKSYTDDDLRGHWAAQPAQYKALASRCSDEQVKEYIQKKVLPDADADTLNRAVAIVRSAS